MQWKELMNPFAKHTEKKKVDLVQICYSCDID